MSEITQSVLSGKLDRSVLFGKLNQLGFQSVESAYIFCEMRGNPYVELLHWIFQIYKLPETDFHLILKRFEINPTRLAEDLTAALDRLPRGSTAVVTFSPQLEEAVERGWVIGSLLYGESQVRTGHVLVGIVKSPILRSVLLAMSPEFKKIKAEALDDDFAAIVKSSPEESLRAQDGSAINSPASGQAGGTFAPAAMGKQEALAKFSVDLTERARKGELDPIVGRDEEIRQIVDILMRRRQNNPILTGEAGVGKTAVVEGFALRIAAGDVPPGLKDVSVRVLDIGLLQAGASMKGEFEQRLRQVIEEVQGSPKPIILFIDEAHTLIGAGGAQGTGDAANLLKPALARGTLRTIAATTWAEYKKYIEKDPALTRRFQVIKVEEPAEDRAILMMRGLLAVLEKHHRVQILDEAVEASVKLSHRYIPGRQLPDKSVSLLDTACARVAISQHATPAAVEDSQRRIQAWENELEIVAREQAIGVAHEGRQAAVTEKLGGERERLVELERHWKEEKAQVDKILDLRAKLRASVPQAVGKKPPVEAGTAPVVEAAPAGGGPDAPNGERATLLKELRELQEKLTVVQGERPLILPSVDQQTVAAVVASWTGIPVGRMVRNEIQSVLSLADTLEKRIIGQRHGLDMIAKRIQTSRAKLDNPNKPVGVFLLAGPSGVGKTETALSLAEALYGGESNIITINMSEFQEAHTVSTLKGSPPGYVGYGEGGVLTEQVRRRPYSVVLLDEVEKAHHDVHEIFFQVFEKGWMEDAEGRGIDFKNTIILLTTNIGTDLIMNMCKDPDLKPDPAGLAKALRTPLLKTFPPALLGRLVVIPYYPLSDAMLKQIIRLQLKRIQTRVMDNHRVELVADEAVVDVIASRCTELESGARMVDAILTHTLLPEMSREILTRLMDGRAISRVRVGIQESNFTYTFD